MCSHELAPPNNPEYVWRYVQPRLGAARLKSGYRLRAGVAVRVTELYRDRMACWVVTDWGASLRMLTQNLDFGYEFKTRRASGFRRAILGRCGGSCGSVPNCMVALPGAWATTGERWIWRPWRECYDGMDGATSGAVPAPGRGEGFGMYSARWRKARPSPSWNLPRSTR